MPRPFNTKSNGYDNFGAEDQTYSSDETEGFPAQTQHMTHTTQTQPRSAGHASSPVYAQPPPPEAPQQPVVGLPQASPYGYAYAIPQAFAYGGQYPAYPHPGGTPVLPMAAVHSSQVQQGMPPPMAYVGSPGPEGHPPVFSPMMGPTFAPTVQHLHASPVMVIPPEQDNKPVIISLIIFLLGFLCCPIWCAGWMYTRNPNPVARWLGIASIICTVVWIILGVSLGSTIAAHAEDAQACPWSHKNDCLRFAQAGLCGWCPRTMTCTRQSSCEAFGWIPSGGSWNHTGDDWNYHH